MKSVNVLPANQSLVVMDSQFKKPNESVYNFTGTFGGSGLYCKEIYYSKLYWNQPLFAHNNTNNELIFSLNDDDTIKYVVYATPFLMYTSFDGNESGTSLLPPKEWSYAKNMELALNNDVRLLTNNAAPLFGDGKVRFRNLPMESIISFEFRYNPSKGFCVYPVQDNEEYVYTIKFWKCNYISKAHFTHGFGILNPSLSTTEYVPKTYYSPQIWSDTTPLLLPFRYILIRSLALSKDRRLMSFQNGGNNSSVSSEVAIFPCEFNKTGVYSILSQGEDASVISLRKEYTPQDFDISILGEAENVLRCGDPISLFLQDPLVEVSSKTSFLSGPFRNRGNYLTTNYLVFGREWKIGSSSPSSQTTSIYYQSSLNTMHSFSLSTDDSTIASQFFNPLFRVRNSIPILTQSIHEFLINGVPPMIRGSSTLSYPNTPTPSVTSFASNFLWDYLLCSSPQLSLYVNIDFAKTLLNPPASTFTGNVYVFMYDVGAENDSNVLTNQFSYQFLEDGSASGMPIGVWKIGDYTLSGTTAKSFYTPIGVGINGSWNPYFNPYSQYRDLSKIPVVFCFVVCSSPTYGDPESAKIEWYITGPPLIGSNQPFFGILGTMNTESNYYNSPVLHDYSYGDPQADGLCEPLLHEFVAVLEDN